MSKGLFELIEEHGLLPMHDASVLSATSFLAGEPVHGSWWSHSSANDMYREISEAEDHADVEMVKLLGGKLTFVHRRLWLPLLAVVTERADWQTNGLPRTAARLLEKMEDSKTLRADAIRELKKEVKLVEERLLVFASSVHTEAGRHEKVLETWEVWKKRVGLTGKKPGVAKAREQLEGAAAPFSPLKLPWMKKRG